MEFLCTWLEINLTHLSENPVDGILTLIQVMDLCRQ